MDSMTTDALSRENGEISRRSQELTQQLMTYQVLGYLPARAGAFKHIKALREALEKVEQLLQVPRYRGDTFGEKKEESPHV